MTTDEELRRLAQAATPGKWLQRGGASVVTVLQGNTFKILAVVGAPQMAQGLEYAGRTANAAFIAAADPSRILQLLDERDALRERVGALENEVDTLRYLDDEAQIGADAQTAELRQAQAEVKRLTAERDELRGVVDALETWLRDREMGQRKTIECEVTIGRVDALADTHSRAFGTYHSRGDTLREALTRLAAAVQTGPQTDEVTHG